MEWIKWHVLKSNWQRSKDKKWKETKKGTGALLGERECVIYIYYSVYVFLWTTFCYLDALAIQNASEKEKRKLFSILYSNIDWLKKRKKKIKCISVKFECCLFSWYHHYGIEVTTNQSIFIGCVKSEHILNKHSFDIDTR